MTEKTIKELQKDFVDAFATCGVELSQEDVEIIFNIYSVKTSNMIKLLGVANTNNAIQNKTEKEIQDETEVC